MTTGRHDDRSDGRRRANDADPWDAIGHPENDDFWADVPDWSSTASTSRRSAAGRIGGAEEELVDPTPIGSDRDRTDRSGVVGALRGAWNGLLGSAPDTTREHRRLDVTDPSKVSNPPSPADGWGDDWDDDWGDEAWEYDAPHDVRQARAEPGTTAPDGHDLHDGGGDTPRDAEFELGPGIDPADPDADTGRRQRRGPIDPLLMRAGAIVIIACLIVPMLVAAARTDRTLDDPSEILASATAAEATPPAPPATQPDPPTTEPLDPATLPPAVPVNTEPAADTRSEPADANESAAVERADTTAAESDDTGADESVDATIDAVAEPAIAERPASRVDPPLCPVSYTVVAGDFWLRLADAADVDLGDLLEVNSATQDTPLFPGSEICLPEGATTPAPPTTAAPTTAPPTTAPPTTAPPTTAPPATQPAPAQPPTSTPSSPQSTPEQVQQIIREVWPDDLEDRAIEIAFRESRFVPTAKNFCCYGIFQMYWEVHDVWLVDLGITSASQLYDPATNARAALALYERAGGWGPWGF